jgi:hypothetical protein
MHTQTVFTLEGAQYLCNKTIDVLLKHLVFQLRHISII